MGFFPSSLRTFKQEWFASFHQSKTDHNLQKTNAAVFEVSKLQCHAVYAVCVSTPMPSINQEVKVADKDRIS